VIVPRSLAFAPPEAVTDPVAVTGGHAPAHAPEQADLPPLSLTHRYTARPGPSVRNVPADDEAVVITVAPDQPALPLAAALLAAALLLAGDAPAGELLAAAAPVLLLLLPLAHAAASSATPAAPPTAVASLAGADIRFNIKFSIVLVSRLARPIRARVRSPDDCRYTYGQGAVRDWSPLEKTETEMRFCTSLFPLFPPAGRRHRAQRGLSAATRGKQDRA